MSFLRIGSNRHLAFKGVIFLCVILIGIRGCLINERGSFLFFWYILIILFAIYFFVLEVFKKMEKFGGADESKVEVDQRELKIPCAEFYSKRAKIVRWTRKEGEVVNKGDMVAFIESSTWSMELIAKASGVLEIYALEGDETDVGVSIGMIKEID